MSSPVQAAIDAPTSDAPATYRRPWTVPPAPAGPHGHFDGSAVLEELPEPIAIPVWQFVRDFRLWTETPPEQRRDLFAVRAIANRRRLLTRLGGECPPAMLSALTGLSSVMSDNNQEEERAASHLLAIAEWASDTGYLRTAFYVATEAALARPTDPILSYTAAMMARRVADYRRSEAWFRRSLALARKAGDPKAYGRALLGFANLHMQRFDVDAARAMLLRTVKVARRYSLWALRPLAYHDLFLLTTTEGSLADAVRYASAALRGYGRFHPVLPNLAHDFAWMLLCAGYPEPVLPLLKELAKMQRPAVWKLIVLANVGRAAGALGQTSDFLAAWNEIWCILDARESDERAAEALISLARGAEALGDDARAQLAAQEALRIGLPREEFQEVEAAEDLLAALREHRRPIPQIRGATDEEIASTVALVQELLSAILELPVYTPA